MYDILTVQNFRPSQRYVWHSVPLGYGATSLGALCTTFEEHYAISKRREPVTQYRVATTHSNGEENS